MSTSDAVWNPTTTVVLRLRPSHASGGSEIEISANSKTELCRAIGGTLVRGESPDRFALSPVERSQLEAWIESRPHVSLNVAAAVPGEGLRMNELDFLKAPLLADYVLGSLSSPLPPPSELEDELERLGCRCLPERLPRPARLWCDLNGTSGGADREPVERLEINPSALLQFDRSFPKEVEGPGFSELGFDPRRPILWLTDFGAGLPYPLWPARELQAPILELLAHERTIETLTSDQMNALCAAGFLLPRSAAQRRANERALALSQLREQLETQRYAILRNVVPPSLLSGLQSYVRQLESEGHFLVGDKLCNTRLGLRNNAVAALLHRPFAALLKKTIGSGLTPTMSYLMVYRAGADLPPHVDLDDLCAWNISLALDSEPQGSLGRWPLALEVEGTVEEVCLDPGDLVIYQGNRSRHWRGPLPAGQSAYLCSFHFDTSRFQVP